MPVLTVKLGEKERRILFLPDRSLMEILNATDIRVRSGCMGIGGCGLCRVRIIAGEVNAPTPEERKHLHSTQLANGVRLACQVNPKQDVQIIILNTAPKSNWKSLPRGESRRRTHYPTSSLRELPKQVNNPYGVAVDLGTTHISLSLLDFASGQRLAGRYSLNPQMKFGADIITRLVAASESLENVQMMSRQVIAAIGEALLDVALREGIDLKQVVRLTLVGNTAMLALLSGRNYELLLDPSHWMHPIDCLPENTGVWAASWDINPQAVVEVVSPLAGFVGSDLLAGVVATHLFENVAGILFIDFGTNSEIALWDGKVLWVTSAAGGPAFEGCGISCGFPAEPGAIYRLRAVDESPDFDVIAGSEPRGLCGSGLVDLIAHLIRAGKLTKIGKFATNVPQAGFTVVEGEPGIVLTKGDVDVFQRAKAAIGVGIKVVLAKAKMDFTELQRIYIGGAFGLFLNVANAIEIGLLPGNQPDLIELCGNTALAGCEDILLSSVAAEHLQSLIERAEIINLAQCDDFDDIFFDNLYLEPMVVNKR